MKQKQSKQSAPDMVVFVRSGVWVVKHSDPQIEVLFKTNTIPTPYLASMAAVEVLSRLQGLNPGKIVILRNSRDWSREAVTEQRETFAQYLRRVGQDYQASDSDSATAEDYAMAAKRIEELEEGMEYLAQQLAFHAKNADGNKFLNQDRFSVLGRRADSFITDKFQHLN